MLTDDDKRRLLEQETYLAEVRRAAAGGAKPGNGAAARIAGFFETKAGFWLLTTVLAGLFATGMSHLQQYLDRHETEARQQAENARRDTEMLLKLVPMLFGTKPGERGVAVALLDSLTSRAGIDERIGRQVRALSDAAVLAGTQPSATNEERQLADAILRFADRNPDSQLVGAGPADAKAPGGAGTGGSGPVNTRPLPTRIYVQIPGESDRARATALVDTLRRSGYAVPGIEVVGTAKSPSRASLRYCSERSDPGVVEQAARAIAEAGERTVKADALPASLCRNVRTNQLELWLPNA